MDVTWPTRYVSTRRSPWESPIAEALSRCSLFADVEPTVLTALAKEAMLKSFQKRSPIVRPGDAPNFFYVVVNGVVAMHHAGRDRDTIISLAQDSDFFGEWVLGGATASYGVYSLRESSIVVIDAKAFAEVLISHPKIARSFAVTLEQRFRASTLVTRSIATQDIAERMARLLLMLAGQFGSEQPDGMKITLRLTNAEMASMVATTRETVNRTLNKFWDQKLVDMRSSYIILKDFSKLRDLAGDV